MYDFSIVGGGIVGLATALALGRRFPGARILLLEKESTWAAHQSGHNSGVIHAGIYYTPGSDKARLCREGSRLLVQFCREHHIAHTLCGKVIVATSVLELPGLERLFRRGVANGLAVRQVTREEVSEHEPHVQCVAGLYVPETGIVDYAQVAVAYARVAAAQGAELRLSTTVMGIKPDGTGHILETSAGSFQSRFLINCAGLHSDRIARLAGSRPEAQIVPFRGEYYELVPEKRHLVRTLIYPVPNPEFPFLGVHFTRMIDGSVHAGPNAVLSFKREGYRKSDLDLIDLAEVLAYPGFWKLGVRHWQEGAKEIWRSVSKAAFVRSLQRLVPEVSADDVVPAGAGVRAQALRRDGRLVDDFLFVEAGNALHVCNAPSPAATSSLAIGQAIAQRVDFTPAQISIPQRKSV